MDPLYPYPNDPIPAVKLLVSKLRGGDAPPAELGHAAWHLAGYALSQFDPHPVVTARPPLSDHDAAALLEGNLLAKHGGVAAIDVPWDVILSLAIQLLQRWLGK